MQNKMVENRKMHDAWAAILYMILISLFMIFMPKLIDSSSIKETMKNNQRLIGYTLLYTFSTILLMFVGFLYITRFLLHTAYIVSIAAGMIFGIIQILNGGTMSMICGVLCIIISLMALMIYLMSTRYRIDKTAIILKATTTLLCDNLNMIMFLITTTSVIHLVLLAIFIPFYEEKYNMGSRFIEAIPLIFIFIWSFQNLYYTYLVFIGSISSIQIFSARMSHNVFGKAIRNVFFALGSICLGGLITGILIVARIFSQQKLKNTRTNNEEEKGKQLFIIIMCFICMLIASLLTDIAEFLNSIAFPYIAINGTSYKESIRASYSLITDHNLFIIIDSIILGRVLTVFIVFSVIIYAIIGYGLGFIEFNSCSDSICLFCPIILVFTCTAFIAAYRTIVIIYALDRQSLKRTLPGVVETFKDIKMSK